MSKQRKKHGALEGRTALITGASRGIGLAIARAFAAEGARLLLVSRSAPPKLAGARYLRADVSQAADVKRVFQEIRGLDLLINNAGIADASPVAKTSDALWHETLGVNLNGTFFCTRAALALMLPRRRGHIVNILSVAATTAFEDNAAYCAAKAGALAFTRVLREEVRGKGIHVTAILPGAVDTAIWDRLWPGAPREKMMHSSAVARAVLHAVTTPEPALTEEIVLAPISGSL